MPTLPKSGKAAITTGEDFSTNHQLKHHETQTTMKGKENRKESKKAKADGKTIKVQSDYQKDKTRKSNPDSVVFKSPKK